MREGEKDILPGNHPKVPVTGFTWVHKKGGGSSTREGGCNFAADMTGFAHSSDNDSALATQDQSTSPRESFINPFPERKNRSGLVFNDPSGRCAEQVSMRMARFALNSERHGVLYSHADIMPFLKAQEWLCLRNSYFCSVAFLP